MKVDIESIAGLAMSLLKLELRSKLKAQGYGSSSSTSLINSIEHEIKTVSKVVVGLMYMNDYYGIVEEGVSASKIPYSPGRGRGGVSKYIQGLISFFMRKVRLGFKEAKGASFATANKHKKEGMPLRSSLKYSSDGTRTGFIKDTIEKNLVAVNDLVQRETGKEIEVQFSLMLRDLSSKGFDVSV